MAPQRTSIDVPGMPHGQPIPNGSRVGNMVFSSAITGRDTESQSLPDDPEEQARFLFKNIQTFVEVAGGTPENIAHVTVFLQDDKYRPAINKEWVKMFPDEKSRPARHALIGNVRGGGALFQVELIAVL